MKETKLKEIYEITRQSKLYNTSLCSIVRDEIMNPAGGIERFVHSHVPFVEEAIIVDTGSKDGTREILEKLKGIYDNLKVIDLPFEGYAETRNRALSYVNKKNVLILDADELITHKKPNNDWGIIQNFLLNKKYDSFSFFFDIISKEKILKNESSGQPIRIIDSSIKNPFIKTLWEKADKTKLKNTCNLPVSIKHFLPSEIAMKIKLDEWYMDNFYDYKNDFSDIERLEAWKESPSNFPNFKLWKEYNPRRDDYE
jgi:glycosyltransferase involved in cell wall biosynthesis